MQSLYGPTSAGKGQENRRPWVRKGAPQVKFHPPGGPLESSWGVLGAKSASEGRSGRKRGVWKLKGGLLGPSWGPLGASWAHFGSHFPPPWGAPGRLQEVIFRLFWDVPAEILKMSFCLLFFHIFGVFFLCYYLPSVVFLAPWLAASCICKKLKIHWFLWVARHMRLVLATPEAINFQWGRVINIGGRKRAQKKDPRDQKTRSTKEHFEAKMAPKVDPGGFQTRVHKTVGN